MMANNEKVKKFWVDPIFKVGERVWVLDDIDRLPGRIIAIIVLGDTLMYRVAQYQVEDTEYYDYQLTQTDPGPVEKSDDEEEP